MWNPPVQVNINSSEWDRNRGEGVDDVLIPQIRNELNVQRQLTVDAICLHMAELVQKLHSEHASILPLDEPKHITFQDGEQALKDKSLSKSLQITSLFQEKFSPYEIQQFAEGLIIEDVTQPGSGDFAIGPDFTAFGATKPHNRVRMSNITSSTEDTKQSRVKSTELADASINPLLVELDMPVSPETTPKVRYGPGVTSNLNLGSSNVLGSSMPGMTSKSIGLGLNSRTSDPSNNPSKSRVSGDFKSLQTGIMDPRDVAEKLAFMATNKLHQSMVLDTDLGNDGNNDDKSRLFRAVHSLTFRLCISVVILANSATIGMQTGAEVQDALSSKDTIEMSKWQLTERIFTIVFILEIALRIASEGRSFKDGPHKFWNAFDMMLVIQSLIDASLELLDVGGSANMSFSRTVRILRFARILRIVRVIRLFRSFRVMIHSILHSMLSLVWIFLMLLFVIYFFAVVLLQGVAAEVRTTILEDGVVRQLQEIYGSVPHALLSLFMGITGGKDWTELYAPLSHLHWVYPAILILYIYFAVFGVLNTVTSVFVEATYQASQSDRDHVVQAELDRNKMYMRACREFFLAADKDKSGELSWEEFESFLSDEKVRAYLTTLELDETQARALFTLLDVNEDHSVSLEEFVEGCGRLKGGAKSIDVNMLLYENEKMISKWTDFMVNMEDKLSSIQEGLGIDSHEDLTRTSSNDGEDAESDDHSGLLANKSSVHTHQTDTRLDAALAVIKRTSRKLATIPPLYPQQRRRASTASSSSAFEIMSHHPSASAASGRYHPSARSRGRTEDTIHTMV